MPEAPLRLGPEGSRALGTGIDGRNPGLDLARAAAIILVLASHISSFGFPLGEQGNIAAAVPGAFGVELFFALSGFLIGRILLRLAADLRPAGVATFMGRRWLRTLPLYYAALLLYSWLFQTFQGTSFVFLQTLWPHAPCAMPQSWSLVLEELFYLGFPLVMLLVGRRGPAAPGALVVRVAIGFIAVAWLARLMATLAGWGLDDRLHPLMRLDCAAYGVLAACLDERRRSPRGLAAALALAAVWIAVDVLLQESNSAAAWRRVAMAARWPILDGITALLVWSCCHQIRRVPHGIVLVSRLSYSIYVDHLLVLAFWLHPVFDATGPGLGVIVIVAIILGLAGLTWTLIEQPFLLLRNRFL